MEADFNSSKIYKYRRRLDICLHVQFWLPILSYLNDSWINQNNKILHQIVSVYIFPCKKFVSEALGIETLQVIQYYYMN